MSMILITGASRGIGLELAVQYAEAGDQVIATCRDPETATALKHLAESHKGVEVLPLDVVDPLSVLSLASMLSKRGSRIDLLINNAAILVHEEVGQWSADAFSATMETNVVGPSIVMQAFANGMAVGGRMVSISSGLGSFAMKQDFGGPRGTYAVSKAALNMVVAQMTPWLKEKHITAVVVHPGWVRTDMGGQGATLSVEESVEALRGLFAKLELGDSGKFLDYTGEELAW